MKEDKRNKKRIKTILAFVLAVFVGGGNFITALQGCIWMVLISGLFIILKNKNDKRRIKDILVKRGEVYVPVITIIISFAISVLAPGNQVRIASAGNGFNPIKAIIVSFAYCLEMPIEEWLSFPIILALALAVPFMWNVVRKSKMHFTYPGVVVILGFTVASAAYTPNLYAQGSMTAGRLHDTAYFIFITILYVVMFYVVGWIQQLMGQEQSGSRANEMSERMIIYVVVLSMFLVGSSVLDIAIDEDTYVGSEAFLCLISGQAENYKEENEIRLEMLSNSSKEVIEFTGFTNPPELLHFQDIVADENDWVNLAVARYYGKECVRRIE